MSKSDNAHSKLTYMGLVLASTSTSRKKQLQSLAYTFRCVAPKVKEDFIGGELPNVRAVRLARQKALSVATAFPSAIVVGGDQVAHCEGKVVSKPMTVQKAHKQLGFISGKTVEFHSAVCIALPKRAPIEFVDETVVIFRELSSEEIVNYVDLDQPLQSSGAFKYESLGLHLFSSIKTEDPSALLGLPMMKLAQVLRSLGTNPLLDH